MTIVRSLALFVVMLGLSGGCVDTTFLHYEKPPKPDAGSGDGGGVDPGVVAACRQCVTGDGAPCRAPYDVCSADTKCKDFVDCLLEFECLSPPELQQRIDCAQPCFTRFGIKDGQDPVIVQMLPLNACTLDAAGCRDACFVAR